MSEQSEPIPDDHRSAHERLRGADKLLALRVEAVEEDQKDQGRRLSKLENERWFVYGAIAAIGAVASWVLRGLGLNEK